MNTQLTTSNNIQHLLTPEQVSATLGITSGTLQVWRTTRRYNLPYVKVGGRVMYRTEDIQNFIKCRTKSYTT